MIATQWGLFALPVVIWLKFFRLNMTETLQLRPASPQGFIGAALIGLSAWASLAPLIMWLQDMIMEMPPSVAEQMNEQMGLNDLQLNLVVALFAFALSPAICEELLFRGLIFGGLRQHLRPWTAICITGLLFGLMHVSLYRILPTGILGVVITMVALYTRSLWTGVLLHALHNGTILVVSHTNFMNLAKGDAPPWLLAVAGVAFVAGVALVLTDRRRPQPAPATATDLPTPDSPAP
jgi:sodium transport system permease protein